jgi:hypothetical protein
MLGWPPLSSNVRPHQNLFSASKFRKQYKGNFTMKTTSICFLAAMLSLSFDANSATQTYSFSGTLTDIRGSGANQTFGNKFSATYVYDNSPQAGHLIEANRQGYVGGQFAVYAGNASYVGPVNSELQVFNDWTNTIGGYLHADGYFVSSYVYDQNPSSFYLIQFDLWDHSGTTLNSLAMPSGSEVEQLARNGRVWIRRFESGTETGLASGSFSTFTPTSPVPEPSSLALAILPAMFILARSKKTFKVICNVA